MPILSFDADNRHNSLDYFTHCTHMWRGMIMKYINSTMHHTILCKSIGGFRGVSKVSGNHLPFYLMHCPCGVRAWMAELAVIIPCLDNYMLVSISHQSC